MAPADSGLRFWLLLYAVTTSLPALNDLGTDRRSEV